MRYRTLPRESISCKSPMSTKMKQLLSISFASLFALVSYAQPSAPGDVAVIYHLSETVAHGTAGDRIGLVLLTSMASGASFKLTENGSNGTQLDNDEGIITVTATTAHSFGKKINITLNNGAVIASTPGFSFSTSSGPYALSTAGDQSIVYLGTEASPTFIYSAHFNGTSWLTCNNGAWPNACGGNQSNMPTSGTTFAFGVSSPEEYDNNWFNGSTAFANKASALSAITNTANWMGNDDPAPAETAINTILPVNWYSLKAYKEKDGNLILWQTATEVNNAYFEIERSFDAQHFTTIGKVMGSGTTTGLNSYQFLDAITEEGKIYYYRIKQVDFDGMEDYSNLISIYLKGLDSSVKVSPNPTTDFLNIEFEEQLEDELTLELLNAHGAIISTVTLPESTKSKYLGIADLPNGVYLLRSRGAEVITRRIIKVAN
jgi:hypothetical protein